MLSSQLALEFDKEISFLMCIFEGSPVVAVVSSLLDSEVQRRCMLGKDISKSKRKPETICSLLGEVGTSVRKAISEVILY